MTADDNEIVVYQPDETVRLDVRLDGDTVWLTQNQMTDLFQRGRYIRCLCIEHALDHHRRTTANGNCTNMNLSCHRFTP